MDIDLAQGIVPNEISIGGDNANSHAAALDFAVKLFKQSVSLEENALISPLSVLCALGMVANGADGNTLVQMEDVLGFSVSELNEYVYLYTKVMTSDGGGAFHLANALWLRDSGALVAEQAFLQVNADYYGAGIHKAPFDDNTLQAINRWVSDNTDGMIENILREISREDVMYLINALAFDAVWQTVYSEGQVRDGVFTSLSGAKRDVEMMFGEEYAYLDDGKATGFIKKYKGGRYAYAALLPNEELTIDGYIATLTGKSLADTLRSARGIKVNTVTPKFKSGFSVELGDILGVMGMSDAFEPRLANFTRLGYSSHGNIYIGRVVHKTFISVDAQGTKAGAATMIIAKRTSMELEFKTVRLERPFVYLLLDCKTSLPFFIGTVLDL